MRASTRIAAIVLSAATMATPLSVASASAATTPKSPAQAQQASTTMTWWSPQDGKSINFNMQDFQYYSSATILDANTPLSAKYRTQLAALTPQARKVHEAKVDWLLEKSATTGENPMVEAKHYSYLRVMLDGLRSSDVRVRTQILDDQAISATVAAFPMIKHQVTGNIPLPAWVASKDKEATSAANNAIFAVRAQNQFGSIPFLGFIYNNAASAAIGNAQVAMDRSPFHYTYTI